MNHLALIDETTDPMAREQWEALWNSWVLNSAIPERYRNPDSNRLPQCRELSIYIAGARANMEEGIGMILTGPKGTGKSQALSAALQAMWRPADGPSARWIHSGALFDLLHRKDVDEEVRQVRGCQVLVIDDFGTEYLAEFGLSRFDILVEERYSHRRAVLVSTNTPLDKLVADTRLQRVMDRWRETCLVAVVDGQSQRRPPEPRLTQSGSYARNADGTWEAV